MIKHQLKIQVSAFHLDTVFNTSLQLNLKGRFCFSETAFSYQVCNVKIIDRFKGKAYVIQTTLAHQKIYRS